MNVMSSIGNDLFTLITFCTVYLMLVFASLTLTTTSVFVFYVFILSYSIYSLFRITVKTSYLKLLIAGGIFSLCLYLYLFPYINAVELWGDEITEIQVATLPFGRIYSSVKAYYYSSPPLGFWSLWAWNKLVEYLPVNVYEFFYRIPYMFLHVLSAGIFGVLVCKIGRYNKTEPSSRLEAVVFCVAFLTFFVNPIIFLYSIEVRSYMMSILGSLVGLFFFVNPYQFQKDHIFLMYFFCLHAIVEFIVMVPLWVVFFIKRVINKRVFFVMTATTLVLAYIIKQNISSPKAATLERSYELVTIALQSYISMQVFSIVQILFILVVSICIVRKRDHAMFGVVISIFFFFFITAASGLYMRYYDFHLRHFSFLTPWFILLLFSPLRYVKEKIQIILLVLIFVLFTFPWTQQTYLQLTSPAISSKSLKDNKKIMQIAKQTNGRIILLPNTKKSMTDDVFTFYEDSVKWYANKYSVLFMAPIEESSACALFTSREHSILLDITNTIDSACGGRFPLLQGQGVKYRMNSLL